MYAVCVAEGPCGAYMRACACVYARGVSHGCDVCRRGAMWCVAEGVYMRGVCRMLARRRVVCKH